MGKYQAYPEYKYSEVEWLEELPAHWSISKLRYIFSFGKGLTITKENLLDEGIHCVNYGEVHSKYGFEVDPAIHPLKCVTEEYLKSSPCALLSQGDLVFADTSEDIEGSGNFTQLTSDQAVFAGYHTIIARPKDRWCSRFYAYLLDSQEIRTQIRHAVKGVKVFSVTQAILRGVNIWLPTLEEREQIANFLDHETAKIDTLIEKQQQLIKLLKEKRQAVISHAVTKGLTNLPGANLNSSSAAGPKGEGRDSPSNPDAPMRDSGVEWLGEVPAHWDVARFKHLITERAAGPYGSSLTKSMYTSSGVRVYGQQQVIPDDFSIGDYYIPEEKFEEMRRYVVNPGDVLISVMGTVGKVAVVPKGIERGIINPRLVKYRVMEEILLPGFAKASILSDVSQSQLLFAAQGSTMDGLNMQIIGELPVAYPSIDEQLEILNEITRQEEKYDSLIYHAERAINLLQERRTALISAAVTGKIDVRDWVAPAPQTNKEDAA